MLSPRDNDLLTLTGPGTPMGDLLRRYWIPVVLADEVPAGGRVKRVQLLGERLVVHRTPSGRPGVIAEFCPHRGASLYFGRNEEGGPACAASTTAGSSRSTASAWRCRASLRNPASRPRCATRRIRARSAVA
jgi:hypothetical protein